MKRAYLIAAVAAALTLPGCALLPGSVDEIEERAADAVVASIERAQCRTLPVATWQRHYGRDPARAAAWAAICSTRQALPLAP